MAQIKLLVDLDKSKAETAISSLKKEISALAAEYAKIKLPTETVKPFQDTGKTAKSTAANIETLRKSYSNLITQLKTLKGQYDNGIFDKVSASVEQNQKQIVNLSKAYQQNGKLTEQQQAVARQLSNDYKKLSADIAQLKAENDKLRVSDPFSTNISDNVSRLQKRYQALLGTIQSISKYYPKGTFDSLTQSIQADVAQLNSLDKTAASSLPTLNKLNSSILQQEAAFAQARNSATNYHGTLRDLVSGFLKFQVAAMLVMKPLQLIQSAISSINETLVETEKVVVSLQRVLDETVASGEISSELYAIAQNLGQTFDNVQEIAQNFAKAGLSWQDTLKATEAAVLALNVAELTAEESSEGLIAVMQQFNYEASELTYVIDVLNKAADKSAVDTADLLVALQKTGSYASAANLSLEETVGLISALSEATAASGQNIGNALKSLFAYSSKASSLEVFASLSDEMKDIVDMYQIGNASILDVWEELADTMTNLSDAQADLLEQWSSESGLETELGAELGKVYDQLTGVYDTAGVYRKNYFIALLNNFDEVKEVMGEISDASGYTAEEQAKYMDTYEAKLNALQAQWEELTTQETNWLEFKKDLVDMGSTVLTLIDNVGGLKTVLATTGAVFVRYFGSTILTPTITKFTEWSVQIKNVADSLVNGERSVKSYIAQLTQGYNYLELLNRAQLAQTAAVEAQITADQLAAQAQALKNSGTATAAQIEAAETAATQANTVATNANTAAKEASAAASKALASSISLALVAYTAFSAILSKIEQAQEEARQAAEAARQAIIEEIESASNAISTYENASASLYSYIEKIKELRSEQNLSKDAVSDLLDIQSELSETYSDLADNIDLINGKLDEQISKIEEAGKAQLKDWLRENYSAIEEAKEYLNQDIGYLVDENNKDLISSIGQIAEDQNLGEFSELITNLTTKPPNTVLKVWESIKDIFSGDWDDIAGNWTNEYAYTIDFGKTREEAIANIEALYDYISENGESVLGLSKETVSSYLSYLSEALKTYNTDEYKNAQETVDYAQKVQDYLNGLITWEEFLGEAVEETNDDLDDQIKKISTLEDESIDKLIDDLQEIRDLEDEAAELEEKRLDVAEAREAVAEAEAEAAEKLAEAQQELADAQENLNEERLNLLEKQKEATEALVEAQEKLSEATENINSERLSLLEEQKNLQEELADQQEAAEERRLDLLEKQQAVLEAQKALEEARNNRSVWRYNDATGQWDWVTDESAVKDAEEELASAEEAEKEAQEAYDEALQSVEDAKAELEDINLTIQDAEKAIEEAIAKGYDIPKEIWEEEKNIATGVRDAIQNFIEAQQNVSDAEDEVANYEEAIAQAEQAIKEAIEQGLDISAEITESNETLAQGVIDAITAVKDAQQAIKDQEKENAETIASAQESLQEAIDAFNEYIEDQAWDGVISELQSGNATNDSIKEVLDKWKTTAEEQGLTDTSWYQKIVEAIYDSVGVNVTESEESSETSTTVKPPQSGGNIITSNAGNHSGAADLNYRPSNQIHQTTMFDGGGVANGLGYLTKGVEDPEAVNNPELTAKILAPTSNAQFDRYVRDMGILFETAREYAISKPVMQSAVGNSTTTNNNSNNSYSINGVKIGSDMLNRPFGEVLQMMTMVPFKS